MDKADADRPATEALPRALQEMWMQLVHARWSSLAVVPTDPTTSAASLIGTMLSVFELLDLGKFVPVHAEGASLDEGAAKAREVVAAVAGGARVVATVDSPLHSHGAIPVVSACEAALLVLRLGAAETESVRTVIELIGRERLLGCVTLDRRFRLVSPITPPPGEPTR